MPDGLSGSGRSGHEGAGDLSLLLEELARAPSDDLHRAWEQRLKPGDAVGRFEILREVGRGGFGVVYEALDRGLGRSVAFKTLRPGRAGHELSAEWILKEAEAVARLDHPAIVTLHDVGRCESGPYLVEELLHGETLEQRLRRGPLPAREVVGIGLEVARGLAHAYGRGVLHRDLKPGNVFLTEDGRVKLLDFGLAHLLGTRGVQGAGTPAYMAPEQLRGEAVDARADVFALGATLFEALAGKTPFEVKEGRSAALDQGPPPALPEETPGMLAALVYRCLSRDPAKRPASGQAVVEELLAVRRTLERAGLEDRAASAGTPAARKKLRLALLLVGVAVTVAGGAYLVVTRGRSTTEIPGTALVAPALPSIAVLPFADMSPGKDQEYLSEGIAEEILGALARLEGLRVVGRTSSWSFKGKNAPLAEIGRALGVGAVLEGSVRREGPRLRVAASLLAVPDGRTLWTERFDRELGDVFGLQEEIAGAVVRALAPRLLAAAPPASGLPRTSPEAYLRYLEGWQAWNASTEPGVRRAVEAFEAAIDLDGTYAPAWAGLALARSYLGDQSATLTEALDLRRAGMAAADRAVELGPAVARAYEARADLRGTMRREWQEALADADRALALRPGDGSAHRTRAHVLASLGRVAEGLAEARRSVDLEPLAARSWVVLAFALLYTGDLDGARSARRRQLELSPDCTACRRQLAVLAVLRGRPEEARDWILPLAAGDENRLLALAMVEHLRGDAAASRLALAEVEKRAAHINAFEIAETHAFRGEADEAFAWLERALAYEDGGLMGLKASPLLAPLRSDPRWKPFLRKLNLPVE